MRIFLLAFLFVVRFIGLLLRAIGILCGLLLMGGQAALMLADTSDAIKGRGTFFGQLGDMAQRMGMSHAPWEAAVLYFLPGLMGALLLVTLTRENRLGAMRR